MKGFRISKRENVKDNIIRILLEQIDFILGQCENPQQNIHRAIHEIRKSIKRIRAVLRLIREEIGYSTYHRENAFYRDVNRSISDLRTYDVLIITLENLQQDLHGKLPAEGLERITGPVRDQREILLSEVTRDGVTLRNLKESLVQARTRIPDLPIEHDGFEAFSGGVYRMYRHGKEYLISAMKDHDMHHLHDMRKRMKYLWYQVEILKPVYPEAMGAFARSLETITDKLGVYHDLAVLSGYLQKLEGAAEDEVRETLLDACRFKESAMLPVIFRKSRAVFGEEPESLVNRLNEYWNIYYERT